MKLWNTVAPFFPLDAGYLPFGWNALRGLNTLTLLLGLPIALLWGAEALSFGLLDGKRPIAVVLWRQLWQSLVYVGLLVPTLVGATLALNLSASRGALVRAPALALAWCLGAGVFAMSWSPAYCLAGEIPATSAKCNALALDLNQLYSLMRAALSATLVMTLLTVHRRGLEAAAALHESRLQRLNVQRQESEARLRTLQAQIEPHFLFNTLAHIQRLHQVDAPRGASMLASLIDYLRSAMPQMREPESTLGRELALTRAYAHVQQIRMGERLRVEFDVPAALLDARVPPMMVLTLAENAVKHGLSPKGEGGTLRIQARQQSGRLEITVRDDGIGLRLGAGSGLGLANTRSRLEALHGRAAGLDIFNNPQGGVSAVLSLPLQRSSKPAMAAEAVP